MHRDLFFKKELHGIGDETRIAHSAERRIHVLKTKTKYEIVRILKDIPVYSDAPDHAHGEKKGHGKRHFLEPERLVAQKRHGPVVAALHHGCGDGLAVVEGLDDKRTCERPERAHPPAETGIAGGSSGRNRPPGRRRTGQTGSAMQRVTPR